MAECWSKGGRLDISEILIGVAEISIAFAGFSGVVAVFAHRAQGQWQPDDRYRLSFLIETSLLTAVFAFLPLLAWDVAGSERSVWQLCSLLWALFGVLMMLSIRKRRNHVRKAHPELSSTLPIPLITYVGLPAVVLLQVANAILWHEFTPYLAALALGLFTSGIAFARLLRSGLP